MKAKKILDKPPKANGEAAIGKKMVPRLGYPLAKQAKPTILHRLFQSGRQSKACSGGKTHKELHFGRGPNLPNLGSSRQRRFPKNWAL